MRIEWIGEFQNMALFFAKPLRDRFSLDSPIYSPKYRKKNNSGKRRVKQETNKRTLMNRKTTTKKDQHLPQISSLLQQSLENDYLQEIVCIGKWSKTGMNIEKIPLTVYKQ